MKTCTRCGSDGPFYRNRSNADGLSKWCKPCDNMSAKRWAKNNPEKRRAIVKRDNEKRAPIIAEWQRANVEAVRQRNDRWRRHNLPAVRAKLRRYRTKKAMGGGFHTAEQFEELCQLSGHKCLCCDEQKPLEADHIVPVSKSGSSNISNIQPLCRSCNARKNNQTIDYRPVHIKEWAKEVECR